MEFYNTDTFWGRVKERARANGMTLKDLAERLGQSYKSFTNRVTTGTVPKKPGLIEMIAKELGCSTEYLVTGKETQKDVKFSPDLEFVIDTYKHLSEDKKKVVRLLLRALETQQEKEYEDYKREHPELFN